MRAAKATELRSSAVPVVVALVSEDELASLFPVQFHDPDPLAEPEPSMGALVELSSGQYVVVTYGLETGSLTLQLPRAKANERNLHALLAEIRLPADSIVWCLRPKRRLTTKQKAVALGAVAVGTVAAVRITRSALTGRFEKSTGTRKGKVARPQDKTAG